MKEKILNSLINHHKAELQELEINIEIALSNPNSIPDHFEYTTNLMDKLICKAESKKSMVEYLESLL